MKKVLYNIGDKNCKLKVVLFFTNFFIFFTLQFGGEESYNWFVNIFQKKEKRRYITRRYVNIGNK